MSDLDELIEVIPNAQELIEEWATKVYVHHEEIDPDGEHHWGSIVLGWALAKGLTPSQALYFASHVRYRTKFN